MKKTLYILMLFVGAVYIAESSVWAAVTPESFAYGAKLDESGDDAFVEVEVPVDIYKSVTRKDLGDLRVFNADRQVVPHAIRKPIIAKLQKNQTLSYLPFFPITGNKNDKIGDLTLHIERNKQGTIIDVKATDQAGPQDDKTIISYLIDTGGLKSSQTIDVLELSWNNTGADIMGKISIDSSADLVSWRHLTTATVADLDFQGHRLYQNTIALNKRNYKYLRLSWPEQQPPIQINRIAALSRATYTVNTPVRKRIQETARTAGNENNAFLIDLKGHLPVDRIGIRFPTKNSLYKVKLFSGDSLDQPMTEQWRGLVYNLTLRGQIIKNPEITVRPMLHRYWRVVVDTHETQTAPPDLEFGWLPDRLFFLAQGAGPFLLAYGSARIRPADFHLDELIRKYTTQNNREISTKRVNLGPHFLLGGEEALQIPLSLPWKKYILWSVLIAGVTVIGWMAMVLYKQLRDSSDSMEKNE